MFEMRPHTIFASLILRLTRLSRECVCAILLLRYSEMLIHGCGIVAALDSWTITEICVEPVIIDNKYIRVYIYIYTLSIYALIL